MSNKEANKKLLKYELSLFQQIVVLEEDMKSHEHFQYIRNIRFSMKQFMESWEVKVRPNTFSSLLVC